MKLSIIVPVYNMMTDGKLENCLKSLVYQDVKQMEIIAIDDKSTDDSLKLLEEYSKKYGERFVTIASERNRRQGGAKNLGLDRAKGEWIGFVDSDDWVSTDMFSKLLKKAEETGADIVGCDYMLTEAIGKEDGIIEVNNTDVQTGVLEDGKYKELILKPGSMVIKIYKRKLFTENNIRFPENMFYEDNAVGVLPLLYANKFERVPEPLYFYYQNTNSTVHTINLNRCEDRIKAAHIYKDECKKRGFYDNFTQEIEYKIFELGYRNTLFSYIQTNEFPNIGFVFRMQKFLLEQLPDFEKNIYFQKYMDKENKKLIRLHTKNPVLFWIYYELLRNYRRIRYGRKV